MLIWQCRHGILLCSHITVFFSYATIFTVNMRIFGPRTKYPPWIPTGTLTWSRDRSRSPICEYKGRYPAMCRRHFAMVSGKYLTNFWKISSLTPQESVEHVCSGTKTKIRVEDKRYPEPLRDLDISGKSIKLTTWPDWPTAIDCHQPTAMLSYLRATLSSLIRSDDHGESNPAVNRLTDTARRSDRSTDTCLVRQIQNAFWFPSPLERWRGSGR